MLKWSPINVTCSVVRGFGRWVSKVIVPAISAELIDDFKFLIEKYMNLQFSSLNPEPTVMPT